MNKNQRGFSAIELILVLFIIALIGAATWFVYKNEHKVKTPVITTSSKPSKPIPKTTVSTSLNPYPGWLSYCSTDGGLCVKYPSSWKLSNVTGQNSNPEEEDITSPSGDVKVVYQPNDSGPLGAGSSETDNVLSETSPLSTNDFKIIKVVGTESGSIDDDYFVSDNTTIQQNNIALGTRTYNDSMTGIASLFVNSKGPNPQYLQYLAIAQPPNAYVSAFTTNAAALAWFNKTGRDGTNAH